MCLTDVLKQEIGPFGVCLHILTCTPASYFKIEILFVMMKLKWKKGNFFSPIYVYLWIKYIQHSSCHCQINSRWIRANSFWPRPVYRNSFLLLAKLISQICSFIYTVLIYLFFLFIYLSSYFPSRRLHLVARAEMTIT